MRRLAFVDLDLTLFDYTTIRRRGTYAALQAMGFTQPTIALRYIEPLLIKYGDILVEFGFPNFRRVWNAKELFAIVALMRHSTQAHALLKLLHKMEKQLSGLDHGSIDKRLNPFLTRWERRHLLLAGAREYGVDQFPLEVRDLIEDAKSSRLIDDAVTAFNEYLKNNMHEYRDANKVADKLDEYGFEFYVVSEGDPQVQREKLSFLPIGSRTLRSFISGECCSAELLLEKLWNIATCLRDKYSSLISSEDKTFAAIGVIYNEVLEYSLKTPTFFMKVLQTLLLPKANQTKFFNEFRWLSHSDVSVSEPVCLVVIGDRYEKDLFPAIQAFASVTTIRLCTGKYQATYNIEMLEELGLPKPTKTVRSLGEIVRLIPTFHELPSIPKKKISMRHSELHPKKELSLAIDILCNSVQGKKNNLFEQLDLLR